MSKARLRKRGKTYYVYYSVQGKRHAQSLGTESMADARRKFAAIELSLAQKTVTEQLEVVKDQIVTTRAISNAINNQRVTLLDAWALKPYTHTVKRDMRPLRDARGNKLMWTKFVRWAVANRYHFLGDITPEVAEAYIAMLANTGASPATQNRFIVCLRVCFDLHDIKPNPFGSIRRRAEMHNRREIFTREEIVQIIESAPTAELRALLACLAYTGKRLEEVASMRWEYIQGDAFYIYSTKARKYSTFPVLPELAAELDLYGRLKSGPLFYTYCVDHEQWRRYTGKNLSIVISKLIARLGIGDGCGMHYGAHSFRHTFATFAVRAGVPEIVIRSWLGHSSQTVTRIYTDHLDINDKRAAMARLHF